MEVISLTRQYIGWQRSLLRKVVLVSMKSLIQSVMLFTFAQLASICAFLLPLKVIILVASDGIPNYFRFIITPENKDVAIAFLAAGSIGFYFMQLIADHFAERVSITGATRLLVRSGKISLFGNEDQLAKNFYLRFTRNLGSLLIVVIGFAVGLYMNLLLFGTLIAIVICEYFGISIYWQRMLFTKSLNEKLKITSHIPNILRFISNMNFFIGFCILLIVFINVPTFGLLRGLLSFILLRQIMQRLTGAIIDAIFLHKNKTKINALFYTYTHYEPPTCRNEHFFLKQLQPQHRNKWLTKHMHSLNVSIDGPWQLFDGFPKNVALLGASQTNVSHRSVYAKIYGPGPKQELLRNQEKLIFEAFGGRTELIPRVLSEFIYSDLHVFILEGLTGIETLPKDARKAMHLAISSLWSLEPDSRFVDRCSRTRPLMHNRLIEEKISQLQIGASTSQENAMVQDLIASLPLIKQLLLKLPLVLYNPGLKPNSVIINKEGAVMQPHWPGWTLEPIGVGLDENIDLLKLEKMIVESARHRQELQLVTPNDALLAGLIARLETAINKQHFRKPFLYVPEILELIKIK